MEQPTVHILIIDEHPVFLSGLRNTLKSTCPGAELVSANSGSTGLQLAQNTAFDVVVLDYAISDSETTKLIVNLLKALPNAAVLVVADADLYESAAKVLSVGARGFIPKTATEEIFSNAVNTLLAGKLYYEVEIANALIEKTALGKPLGRSVEAAPAAKLLSKRELEIVGHICNQMTNEQIAKKLFLSRRTIDNHRQNIMNKMGVTNTAGLVRFAVEQGLLD